MKKQALKRRSNILRNSTALSGSAALFSALAAVALGGGSAFAVDANTLPTGGNVVGGAATINQSNARMDINQTSNRTVIDWRSFDIGKDAQVNFDQPSSNSIAVNRVNASANASQINGSLTANGQVWVLNANGVMFGKNARIDVAGLVASTARLDQGRFMAGDNRLEFSKGGTGSVVNEGQISIRDGGMAAFVAPAVRNSGVINAKLGRVSLASGDTFTLDLAGDRLVEIGLGSEVASTEQFGQILTDGGVIEITAKAAGDVVDSLVNVDGITSAASAELAGGKIILGGDTVQIAGKVDASGATGGGSIDIEGDSVTTAATADIRSDGLDTSDGGVILAYANIDGQYDGSFSAIGGANGGDGGFIETSGKQVNISDGITVNTSASQGKTGTWSIDPDDLTVVDSGGDGDSTINADTIVINLETTNVELKANDSITVDAEIDSSGQTNSNNLNLADEDQNGVLEINLNANILLGSNQTLTGDGSQINVASTGSIQNGIDVATDGFPGANVNIAAGTYTLDSTVNINKVGITVKGDDGAIVTIGGDRAVAFSINADNATLENMTITGSFSSPYTETDWDESANHSTAINVGTNFTGITVSDNEITNVRTGMTLGSGAEVAVIGNYIDNTKGSILVRTDDATITGNSRGPIGNEWDIVLFGVSADAYTASPLTNEAQYGADIMALSSDNGDMWVLDRRYGAGGFIADTPDIGNRSHVTVLAGSTVTAADDFGLGNGLGNERQPLATINEGISAVVDGGIVNIQAGTYTEKVSVDKTVQLLGAQAGVDARDRDADESILDGAVVFTAESDGSVLDGLKINEGRSDVGDKAGVAIQREATDIAIQNTIFERETELGGNGDGYRGIVTFSNGNQTGLLFENNSFSGWATGIYLNPGAAGAQILDNDFIFNYVGVSNDGPDGSVITGNLFADSGFEGLGVGPGAIDPSATISDNIFQDNAVDIGFYLGSDAEVDVSNNRFDGVEASTATIDELLVIAGQVKDGSDSGNGYSGHASLRDGYIFVTEGESISDGVGLASVSDIVMVGDGTYTLASTLNVSKSLILAGQSEDNTTLDASDVDGYGIYVTADNVSLSDFTLYGPSVGSNTNRGIKVNPSSTATAPLQDFSITDVTIQGSTMAELDLNGVSGATITNVTALGYQTSDGITEETAGAGIQITDSEDVTMTGVVTDGNAWGGVALYQANRSYDLQVNNINIDASENTFNEANGLYIQDSSDSLDFGTLNLAGFTHTVRNDEFRTDLDPGLTDSDQFTFFQVGEQTAVDYALSLGSNAASYIEGWSGTENTGAFTVGTGTEGDTMSIMTAIDAISSKNMPSEKYTVNILAGTYNESIVLGRDFATSGLTNGLEFVGADTGTTAVTGGVRTLQTGDIDGLTFKNLVITGVAENGNMVFDMDNTGIVTDLTLDNLVIDGENVSGLHGFGGQNLAGDFSVTNSTFQNILGWSLMDMDPGNGLISNRQIVTSVTFTGNTIKDSNGNVQIRGNADTPAETVVVKNNSFSNIGGISGETGDQRNALSINNALNVTVEDNSFSNVNIGNFDTGHALLLGEGITSTSIIDNTFTNNVMNFGLQSTTEVNLTQNTVNGVDVANMTQAELLAFAATIDDGTNSANGYAGLAVLKEDHVYVTNGRSVLAGIGLASAGDMVVADSGTFNEDLVDNKQLAFVFNDTIVDSLILNTAGSSLSGSVTADTGGFEFTTDITLDGDTKLTDSADAGVTTAAVDGTTAGGQSLDIISGGSVELGSLGSTTRLGATNIEGSAITLKGNIYKANSLNYDGPVTLTQDLTLFETTQSDSAAGDITFTNNIFGTVDGAQSVSFIAGNGEGDASSNGNVSLQNVGTESVELGDTTVTSHAFSAATVYLAGDFKSAQTGNLTFTDETLNAGGDVTTDVGGAVTGPIKSDGDVEVVAAGDVDSDIEGGAVTVTSTEGGVESEVTATDSVTVVAEEDVKVEVISGGDVEVTSETASVDATVETTETVSVTGAEEVKANATGSAVEIESENSSVEATVEATETVSVTAEEEVIVDASGTEVVIESETSTVDAMVEATETVSVSAEEEVTGEIIASSNVNVSSENASVEMDIDTDENVVVAAKEDVKGTVTGNNVRIEGEDISSDVTAEEEAVLSGTNIDSNVEAKTAIVEAQESLAGTVSAVNAEVTAEDIDVTVEADTVIVDAARGTVNGGSENVVVEGGVISVNDQTVVGGTEADFNQQVVVDFTLPDKVTVSEAGELKMPDLMKIGVISPFGETSTPQVVIVNTVQNLGELLEQGYKAIVVTLDPSAANDVALPSEE